MTPISLESIQQKEVVPGFFARFIHTENMTFAYWNITAGDSIFEHSHIHEQVVNGLEGKFELIVNGDPVIVEPGTVVVIPSNVKHSGMAITDCKLLDVFYPVREDYRSLH
jgi:quercetin dioxygenase-like cupin family protein